jgi:hypothetical protein
MEAVLDNHDKIKQCYSKYPIEDVRKMSPSELKLLCSAERVAFAESFNKLDMKTIIDERLNILKQQREDRYNQRLAELKNYYKL